ncbi:MAG: type III pantothenate kinase [Planctomycetota bacterium]
MDQPRLPSLVAIAVGNTRARVGRFERGDLIEARSLGDLTAQDARDDLKHALGEDPALVAIGSVAPTRSDHLAKLAQEFAPGAEIVRVGKDLPIPILHALDDASTVGHDRLLAALGAYRTAQQACVVIDVGTAVTVDFVDGEGTFQGGAIAPGLQMMLNALNGQTEQLPPLDYERPSDARGPFGKDTPHAMQLGVTSMVRGLVRDRLESYAEAYGAFPQVIATGGDAGILEQTELIDHFVPDLQLMGILAAVEGALEDAGDDEDTGG